MKHKRCKTCEFAPCRCEDLEAGYMGRSNYVRESRPQESQALACHPSQIAAIMERNKKHGIEGVTYKPDGTCVMKSRGARTALMALEGKHDNDGGFGDDHARESPLYRDDVIPFDDSMLEQGHYDERGKKSFYT